MLQQVWLIPVLPALAALVLALAGRRWLGEKLSAWIAIGAMLADAGIALGIFAVVRGAAPGVLPYRTVLYEWFASGSLRIDMAFQVDALTSVMLGFISVVGSLVFIYSIGYMRGDADFVRFFSLLSLFASAMFVLVLGDNFVTMFIGWEGVGLCSYLLIGYYMDKDAAASAGKKAFIVNRIGDFGFLLGMILIFWQCGTLNFAEVFEKAAHGRGFAAGGALITTATLLLFVGATGKSAQIPLFIWLPDAMAGPTPVSALIHAATMVTAGVYMVARCSPLFALAPETLMVIACVGAATAFVAASIGLTQRDIKKVLAYSTISQLGFMFMACGAGAYSAGIFHVFTHAFFKGCLFLCAGSVIHSLAGEQDMFRMGGLRAKMKITWATYLIACLAIAGIPPFSGFFSKDEILWRVWEAGGMYRGLWVVGMAAAFMTAFYMFRSLLLTFHGASRGDHHAFEHAHESPPAMTVPLILLAAGSLAAGFVNLPKALGGTAGFEHFLAPALAGATRGLHGLEVVAEASGAGHEGAASTEILFMIVSVAVAAGGALLAWLVYRGDWKTRAARLARTAGPAYALSANRWWWDDAYNLVAGVGIRIAAALALLFDERVIDGLANGAAFATRRLCERLRQLQNGQVQAYGLAILIGVNAILAYLIIVLA